jgi:predicted SAM-dependent methyltransferase
MLETHRFHGMADRLKELSLREPPVPGRNNILECLAELFNKNSTVLEISPGDGAETKWLAERFKEVDIIAGDQKKAQAVRAMASLYKNVNIYIDDITKDTFSKKYDLIIMPHTLEHILSSEVSNPKVSLMNFLKIMNRILDESGILMLTLENKLGIKQLLGNSNRKSPFPKISQSSFTKQETTELLEEAGFNHKQFYHVFPDNKLPRTIIAENDEVLSLRPYNWIKFQSNDHQFSIPEPIVLKTLTDMGLFWQLSNSFLVLAGKSENTRLKTGWLIKKMNNVSYDIKFHHAITLEEKAPSEYVIKRTPISESKPFFNSQEVEYRLENEEYVDGELLSFSLYRALLEKNPETAVKSVIKILYDSLISKYCTGFTDDSGFPLVNGEAFDYTLWNLVQGKNGDIAFIDKKWHVKKAIPADFILFRNLFHAYLLIHPFLNDKSRRRFILDNIRCIYPRYSRDRLKYDVWLEEKFQSILCEKKVLIGMDSPIDSALNKMAILAQRLEHTDAR